MLTLWTIYDHPLDYPDHFVVRPFTVKAGGATPDPAFYLFEDIIEARRMLNNMGLYPMERSPDDDPVIVETWV